MFVKGRLTGYINRPGLFLHSIKLFVLLQQSLLDSLPGLVGIENLHRLCLPLRIPAEILLVKDPFLVHHEGHDPGILILCRIGNECET